MRYFIVVFPVAVVAAGCSRVLEPAYDPFRGPYDVNVDRLKEAVIDHEGLLATSISDTRNRRYQPGLSITAKAVVRINRPFKVWAVVADDNWKPIKSEWDRNTVVWTLEKLEGDEASVAPLNEKRDGAAMVAEYRLSEPGTYRLECREQSREPGSAPARTESTTIIAE